MKKVLVGVLAVTGVLAIVGFVLIVGLGFLSLFSTPSLPSRVILEVDLDRGVVEGIPEDPLAQIMMEGTVTVLDIVDALDRAAEDRRVVAVVARIGGAGMGLAHLQEIRDAIGRFRASGKPAYAFAETFGEFGPGNGGYYLATGFDRIYLQPSGDVGTTGLIYEAMFVRGVLDKLDITPRLSQRKEYKNAMNYYTDSAYNEPYRRAMQELMDSQFSQMVRGIAEERGLAEERVLELFDQGPHLGREALDAGLVDELAYRDEVLDEIGARFDRGVPEVGVPHYLARAGRPHRRGPTVALIHGYGTVMRGPSSYSPVDGSMTMGADSITSAFRAAIDDDRVQAIVFRVDSPGGSFVASDTIWRETVRAREAGKPVIVSMGNLAGSGGYYVAMDADKIVAQPGTITASIGVLGGKLLTRKAWEKLGVTWDDVATSEHSRMWTTTHDYGTSEERFQASLDRIYSVFTEKVAEARGMPLEQVQEVARGRIWTGEDARERGLVDELGGMEVALRLAKEAAGIDPDENVRLRRFPAPRSRFELLLARLDGGSVGHAGALRSALLLLQPKIRILRRLGLIGEPEVLSIPEIGPIR